MIELWEIAGRQSRSTAQAITANGGGLVCTAGGIAINAHGAREYKGEVKPWGGRRVPPHALGEAASRRRT